MLSANRHRAFLRFASKVMDLTSSYSAEDLEAFREVAFRNFPELGRLLVDYLALAESAQTSVLERLALTKSRRITQNPRSALRRNLHLFDLLRSKQLFPSNADLAEFAARVLPDMAQKRFDKMSRGDIAARIIEYIEERDPRNRQLLEESMRSTLALGTDDLSAHKDSFFRQWERIIKGMEF